MSDPWILHEHEEADCGCGVVVSMYHTIEGDRYANGTDRVTFYRCEEHGGTKNDKEFDNGRMAKVD